MLTNKLDLPEPFLRACEAERYSKGDVRYSASELVKPARMAALERLYRDVIVEDVADHVWSLFGTIVHKILELSGAPETGALIEERLYAEVAGVRISGKMDHCVLYPDGRLDDYKTTSVWAVIHGLKREWEEQLNIYRFLQHANGRAVTALRVVAFLKDWSIGKARASSENGSYPKKAVVALEVPVWDIERAEQFVRERIQTHVEADRWAQEPVHLDKSQQATEPLCSPEERWLRPIRYAVVKEGNKRATRVYDTSGEADYAAHALGNAHIERRGGEPVRCIDYCSVGRAGLCTQWEADKKNFDVQQIDTSAFE